MAEGMWSPESLTGAGRSPSKMAAHVDGGFRAQPGLNSLHLDLSRRLQEYSPDITAAFLHRE